MKLINRRDRFDLRQLVVTGHFSAWPPADDAISPLLGGQNF